MDEDEERTKPASMGLGRSLETMSGDELRDYIAALETEVERVRAELARKDDVRRAAEALFKQAGN